MVIERKGEEYVARCPEMPGIEGRGRDEKDALKSIRTAIIKKLEGGSDAMHPRTHSFAVFLAVGLAGAFLTAMFFIAVIYFALPPSDEAHGQGFFTTLADPFVLTIAAPIATVAGLLASTILFFCLRRRRLTVALPIVLIAVLAMIAVITPLNQLLGLFSGFAALIVSSITCSRIRATSYELSHEAV